MDLAQTIALLLGVAWASGLNLYAACLVLGVLHGTGYVDLPPDLVILADPLVLTVAAFMYCVEFVADKTPGVDSAWDAVHTFIRVPAGAVLAVAAIGDVHPALELAAFLVGGALAGATHATKTGSRLLINTSPEPVSNWAASVTEDVLVLTGLWASLAHPYLFLAFLFAFLVLAAWLLPRTWKRVAGLARRVRLWLAPGSVPARDSPDAP